MFFISMLRVYRFKKSLLRRVMSSIYSRIPSLTILESSGELNSLEGGCTIQVCFNSSYIISRAICFTIGVFVLARTASIVSL